MQSGQGLITIHWSSKGLLILVLLLLTAAMAADPLPTWNDAGNKQAIMAFVKRVTTAGTPDFVPQAERIAAFDNDGTLWPEQPLYVQQVFTFDRIKALSPRHPEWKELQPFKAVLEGDGQTLAAAGLPAVFQLETAARAGLTTDQYAQLVKGWISTARNSKTGRLYTEMVYQPMLELLSYLRANGFKTYIVSGGWADFIRPWAEAVYGIPPEQVIGSSMGTQFELKGGDLPVLKFLPEVSFIDDGPGKPIGLERFIGRRPIAAFGNSDGDLPMLDWTMAGRGPRFALLVHHTDARREWAYDRASSNGRLDQALDQAMAKGWTIVDMKNDWKVIYAFEKAPARKGNLKTYPPLQDFMRQGNS